MPSEYSCILHAEEDGRILIFVNFELADVRTGQSSMPSVRIEDDAVFQNGNQRPLHSVTMQTRCAPFTQMLQHKHTHTHIYIYICVYIYIYALPLIIGKCARQMRVQGLGLYVHVSGRKLWLHGSGSHTGAGTIAGAQWYPCLYTLPGLGS